MREETVEVPARRRRWPRVWTLALAVLGVAVVWLGVFGIVRAYRFMEEDPSFCRTCHTMRQAWDQWQTGEHAGVTCHSCHQSNLVGSLRQVWLYVTQRPDKVHAEPRVTAATCLGCHAAKDSEGGLARADLRHNAGGRTDCLLCHGQELHRFQPPTWNEICASCH